VDVNVKMLHPLKNIINPVKVKININKMIFCKKVKQMIGIDIV